MSVIAVKVQEETIEFASDSITVSGYTQEKAKDKYIKLTEINGMVLGGVGYCQETSMFQMYCETRRPGDGSELAVLNFFCEFLDWQKKKTEKYGSDNHYLLGFAGKVFVIKGFFVKEIIKYEAIGAGSDFALTALFLDSSPVDAVKVACELNVWCEKPIQKITIKKGE